MLNVFLVHPNQETTKQINSYCYMSHDSQLTSISLTNFRITGIVLFGSAKHIAAIQRETLWNAY